MEAQTSNGVIENIQKETSTTKSNIICSISDRSNLMELVEMLHEASIRDHEEICKLKYKLISTQGSLKGAQETLE